MPRVADTSVLYAFFAASDHAHDRAVRDMSLAEPVLVPTEILLETVHLIQRRTGYENARKCLDDLLRLPHVRISEKVHIEAVKKIFDESAGRLSLADAFVVETCRSLAAEPLTYDQHIRVAAGRLRGN